MNSAFNELTTKLSAFTFISSKWCSSFTRWVKCCRKQCLLLLNSGIPTVPGTICLKKDGNNLIGISIGGGAQYCPCLYIVQVERFYRKFHPIVAVVPEFVLFVFNPKWCPPGKPGGLWYLFQSSSRFVSQVFDNTPAALEGTLAAGDEITGVNGKPVKGKTKVEVAKMIQAVQVRLVRQSTTAPPQSTVAFSCELSSTGMA